LSGAEIYLKLSARLFEQLKLMGKLVSVGTWVFHCDPETEF